MDEDLLRKTAKQIGVKLQGQLVPCQGCSEAKGIRKSVKTLTYTRATKPAERCFVDLSGPKSVKSMGGKEYMMIVKDDFSRFTRVFFLRTKDETAMYFKYLAEIAPRKVEVVRSDGAASFRKVLLVPSAQRAARTMGSAGRATSGVTAPTTFSCTTTWAFMMA